MSVSTTEACLINIDLSLRKICEYLGKIAVRLDSWNTNGILEPIGKNKLDIHIK